MPLNCLDATFRSFEQHELSENRRGIATLGIKSMGGSGELVRHEVVTAEALSYAMISPGSSDHQRNGIRRRFGTEFRNRSEISSFNRSSDAGIARTLLF
jgi:hypothetical protein